MDFFKTEALFQGIFSFRETDPFFTRTFINGEEKSSYADAGYESTNFVLNLSPLLMIVLAYIVYLIVKKLLQLSTKCCSANCLTRFLRQDNLYSIVIVRFLLESALEVGLSALITIYSVSEHFSSINSFCVYRWKKRTSRAFRRESQRSWPFSVSWYSLSHHSI